MVKGKAVILMITTETRTIIMGVEMSHSRCVGLLHCLLFVSAVSGTCKAEDDKDAGQPAWIWLHERGELANHVAMRREIAAPDSFSNARLYATCDNSMQVFIDGKEILSHDRWETPVYRNVTKAFRKKRRGNAHVLAVDCTNQGRSPAGLLLKVVFEQGGQPLQTVLTGNHWKGSVNPDGPWKTAIRPAGHWQPAEVVGRMGDAPWHQITALSLARAKTLRDPTATPIGQIKAADGFRVELLYSVPKETQGSWVSMCSGPEGRLIVSDQNGALYRVLPPRVGQTGPVEVEPIPVELGEAQGLLWAFDSLYVVVNRGGKYDSGLYRVRDTNGDDRLDHVQLLRKLNGGGEHGPHAVRLTPDGKSLLVVCGDNTKLPELAESRVPRVWDEDLLLPRPYGRAFMKGVRAPGGFIARTDPDGKEWELVCTGFRNAYDIAFNADGDLFTYDADMEWDVNTPWYRPTRVCLATSGADFGWRNGGGKWPTYFADSLPPIIDIGPGSPTGICFGYGARFPARYQRALFLADWSYGKLYAVHLEPRGSAYSAILEEFVTGTPLPLTDMVVNPADGALYFAIGGRKVQSGLYRVTYVGPHSTAPVDVRQSEPTEALPLRRQLEALHVGSHPRAVDQAWPYLASEDRFIRFAARVAIEHRPVAEWQDRALAERDPQTAVTALLALVRQFPRKEQGRGADIDTPPPLYPAPAPARPALHARVLASLNRVGHQNLSAPMHVQLLRAFTLTFLRLGPPDESSRKILIDQLTAIFPQPSHELNAELAKMLVYLQAPLAAQKIVPALLAAPTQEEQIDLAKSLRHLRVGWTMRLREDYFRWFSRASGYRGGASFALFVKNIKDDAVKQLTADQKAALQPILDLQPETPTSPILQTDRPMVKEWTFDELVPLVLNGLQNRDFDHGRQMFAAANCFACHRFDHRGGALGPDLTSLAGRFSPRDILESVVNPDKTVSDQFAAVQIMTVEGQPVIGRIVNLSGDSISVSTDMLDPNKIVSVNRRMIEIMRPSPVSMMPKGLLNSFHEEEILDLMAYLLSRGDRDHAMFRRKAAEPTLGDQ